MTLADTSRSEAMLADRQKVLPRGVTGAGRWEDPYPLVFVRARGQFIEDVDGTQHLDFHGGYGTAILGYAHPGVDGAVQRAMADGHTFAGCAHIHEAALAERLVGLLPEADRIALCGGGGTDPLYHGLRLARASTGRRKVVKVEGGYQGWQGDLGASTQAPTADIGPTSTPPTVANSTGVLPEVTDAILVVTANDPESLRARFASDGDDIAALFLEPVLYSSGCIVMDPSYLALARELCDRHGAVLVFDEVVSGFRSSVGSAATAMGVVPDLAAYGKAIGNGHVVSCLAGRGDLMDQLAPSGDVFFSGTFNGAPLGVAAATAVLNELQSTDAMDRAVGLCTRLADGVNAAITARGLRAVVQHHGSVFNLYFRATQVRDARELAASLQDGTEALNLALRHHLRDHAIFMQRRPGTNRGFVSAAHTEADIDRAIETIDAFLADHEEALAA
ncbi:MAG: aminotransferase class III-fold pyridoxal phosphate-dependent enzyme [Solirubrobacteraceae bacterium]|nr:aminotransferase class III-fold pyridoxal phosphate-dependent enzyme [Solirubrobacteraceae bacterium]